MSTAADSTDPSRGLPLAEALSGRTAGEGGDGSIGPGGAGPGAESSAQDALGEAPTTRRARRQRPQQTPAQRALGLLVRREHSRKELTRKLACRGVEVDAAMAAVERLAAEGWQDDARFAEGLVRGRAAAGYGPLYIKAELGTHGLDGELIARAMESYEGDWDEVARDLVCRRYGPCGPVDLAQRRKAADLLARRGFAGDSIRHATRFDPDEDA